jgi:hypothetical protein
MTRQRLRILPLALLLLLFACPRGLRVSIVEPRAGALLRGAAVVRARASGPQPVVAVELLANGVSCGVESTASGGIYEFALNSAALLPETSAVLVCVARDAAGTTAGSAPVAVRIFPGTRHSETIIRPETWTAAGNPHVVEGDLLVQALLRIEPGVEVRLAPGAGITVGLVVPGALQAAGEAGRPVRFTSLAASPAPGDWRRLSFRPAAGPESCWLRDCIVEYGSAGMVHAEAAGLVVEGCSLRDARGPGAVAESSGFSRFSGNHVTGCELPVRVDPAGTATLAPDNVFAGNDRDAAGIAGGRLSESTTWERRDWPWAVLAPVTIAGPSAPVLVVAPGCSLLFADSAGIRVGVGLAGALSADGGGGLTVFAPLGDGWRGIEFWNATDPLRTILRRCVITGAGRDAAAALVVYAPVTITDAGVTGSLAAGIHCTGAGFVSFTRNTITGCAGYPLSIEAGWFTDIGPGNTIAGNARDTVEIRPGRVNRNSQWRNLGVPCRVTGMVEVGSEDAPMLVIDNGVRLVFDRDAGIAVGRDSVGRISASGLADSVVFTGAGAEPGSWRGIALHRGAGSQSRLERCRLLYGGRNHPGILHIRESAPLIVGCEIGWSAGHCVVLTDSPLDPDDLLDANWIHDPASGYDEVYEEGFGRDR